MICMRRIVQQSHMYVWLCWYTCVCVYWHRKSEPIVYTMLTHITICTLEHSSGLKVLERSPHPQHKHGRNLCALLARVCVCTGTSRIYTSLISGRGLCSQNLNNSDHTEP